MTPQEAHCAFMAAAITGMAPLLWEKANYAGMAGVARDIADAALIEWQKRWPEDDYVCPTCKGAGGCGG